MKARNKRTGEIVTDFNVSKEWGTASYIDSTRTLRFSTPLDGEWEILEDDKDVDWQAFRREAAKQMLPITSNWKLTKADYTASIPISKEAACKLAIEYADELIKQLKEAKK